MRGVRKGICDMARAWKRIVAGLLIGVLFITVAGKLSSSGRLEGVSHDRYSGGAPYSSDNSTAARNNSYRPTDARDVILGALVRARRDYEQMLDVYDLDEVHFIYSAGCYNLCLNNKYGPFGVYYNINYWPETGYIEWPRVMTRHLAEEFMSKRIVIFTYDGALNIGERH